MTNNQQLAAHCRDVIANPQDHLDWVVDMAKVALASLEAEPVGYTTERAATYEVWNSGSATFWDKNDLGEVALYTAPPVPELKPIELPSRFGPVISQIVKGGVHIPAMRLSPGNGGWLNREAVIKAIRAAGYEVKS